MPRRSALPWVLGLLLLAPALAQDQVTVDDTETRFPTRIELPGAAPEAAPQALRLTGVALREKFWINVYAIASYVAADAEVRTAAELSALDAPKRLHLVLQRAVDSDELSEAFVTALEGNDPQAKQTYRAEIEAFVAYFGEAELPEGSQVRFTHVPGKGVEVQIDAREPRRIEGLPFAKAVWDIYFGAHPVTEEMRAGLVARIAG